MLLVPERGAVQTPDYRQARRTRREARAGRRTPWPIEEEGEYSEDQCDDDSHVECYVG